jgi:hypothetical protein
MAMKKAKPMVAKRVADRKAFVAKQTNMPSRPGADGADSSMSGNSSAKKMARQKFFVQTRVKEMEAKGKTVDAAKRKELRQKFQSGNVSRAGFGAPKKKAASSSTSTASSTAKTTPAMPAKSKPGYSAANISSSAKGKLANHSQRSVSQVVRSRDSELRGSTKPKSSSSSYMDPKYKKSTAGKGKSASQDMNKRPVKPLYKNK